MSTHKINVGIVSAGEHARRNMIPAILESGFVNIHGCFTRSAEVRRDIQSTYQLPVFDSIEGLLEFDGLDAVYISSPTSVHFEQVKKCLEYGKHVLVEKTSFTSEWQAQQLVAVAKEKDLLVMEAFMFQFHNQFKTLRKIIKNKQFGKVKKVECKFGFPHLGNDNIRYKRSLSGGALNDAGAYTVCGSRKLLGKDADVLWSCTNSAEGFEVDISGAAMIKSPTCLAYCSWEFGASYTNEIKLWCEDAIVLAERAFSKPPTYESKVLAFNNGKIVEEYDTGPQNHFVEMLQSFSEAIKSKHYSEIYLDLLEQATLLEKVRNAN